MLIARMNFLFPNECHWTTARLLPRPPCLPLFVTGYLIQGSGSIHMLILPEQQLFTLLITPVVGDADLLTSHRDISMVRRGTLGGGWGLFGVCVPLG